MIFRKEALAHRNKLWQGKALLRKGFPTWLLMVICLVFFTAVLLFLLFSTWHRRITVTGELASVPRAVTITSLWQGVVERSFVQTGTLVQKGTPLYEINIDRTTTAGRLGKIQGENLEQQLASLDSIIERVKQNKALTLELLRRQKNSNQNLLASSQAILQGAERALKTTRKNMENYRRHLQHGLITQDQLINQTTLYHQQEINLLNIGTQHEQHKLQNVMLTSALQTQATDFDNQLYQLEMQKSEKLSLRAGVEASETVVIVSPISGKIEMTGVSSGQMIGQGDSLVQIIPGNVSYYVLVLWVPAHAVPYIAVGDRVNVRYDAFPAEKFGQFYSTVLSISALPTPQQEMATWPSAKAKKDDPTQTWFKLVVRPHNENFRFQNKTFQPQSGMRTSCVLFLEKRRLIEWIFAPLVRISNDVSGPINGR